MKLWWVVRTVKFCTAQAERKWIQRRGRMFALATDTPQQRRSRYDASEPFEWFLGNALRLLCPSSNAIAGDLDLTWQYLLSEFRSEQARAL